MLTYLRQVWAELADGSCRWRQTGGEVKVLALRVPPQLPSKHLAVDLQPYSLKGVLHCCCTILRGLASLPWPCMRTQRAHLEVGGALQQ